MSIPNSEHLVDYGQTTERRIPAGGPVYAGGFIGAQKSPDSISISLEFLRGVEAAAQWAHDNYEEPERADILNEVFAAEVDRLREEATK